MCLPSAGALARGRRKRQTTLLAGPSVSSFGCAQRISARRSVGWPPPPIRSCCSAWRSGAVPPQFSPSHACDSWCQFGANLCRPCRFGRLYRLISYLFSIAQATDTSWHGRGHRFDPDQVHQQPHQNEPLPNPDLFFLEGRRC
jgi:hypothetical protein